MDDRSTANEPSPVARDVRAGDALLRRAGAEAVGTFALVFCGCGAIVVETATGKLGHAGVAATFGLVIAVMVYATGHISGAHFNPAVTVAFATLRRTGLRQAFVYVLAQVAAATLAAALLAQLFAHDTRLGGTMPVTGVAAAFVMEVVLTALLMFVITAVATDERAAGGFAGLAIGGTVGLAAMFGGPISGASMNPARSLGPALVSGATEHQWIYVLAPLIGALAGAWTYQMLRGPDG